MPHAVKLICLLVALAACQTPNQMDGWIGKPEKDLIASVGQPQREVLNSDGSKKLVWEEQQWYRATGASKTSFPVSHISVCRKSFTIDKAGIILSWQFEGCRY